jgi:Ricin-type beta-trefoil lectin domain
MAKVEIGLIALAGTLVAGAILGAGTAQHKLTMPDPMTWLNGGDGRLTRVNPETRQAVDRLKVADDGDEILVSQGDGGTLTVTNLRTHQVTFIDLSQLSAAGTRQAGAGTEVLLHDDRIYLADKETGEVDRVDPLTATTIGEPLRLGAKLSDAAIDTKGALWLLEEKGELVTAAWSDAGARFDQRARRTVPAKGTQAVMVAHEEGVTILNPTTGAISQAGTGNDRETRVPPVGGTLLAAEVSPTNLVAASAPGSAAVLLVHDGQSSTVDSAALGCRKPGRPAVQRGIVFVSCLGESKVIRLGADGRPAGPPILTAKGADPELVQRAGLLIINVPRAGTGFVVDRDGIVREIKTHDPRVPTTDPTARPTALPTSVPTTRVPRPGPTTARPSSAGGPGPTVTATPRAAPTTQAPRPADYTATNVAAQARPDSTVRVAWTAPRLAPNGYRILRADTGEQVAIAAGNASTVIVSGVPLGQPIAFVVEAVTANGSYPSTPSAPVAAYGRPAAPAITPAAIAERTPTSLKLRFTVQVTGDGGSPVSTYDISLTDAGGRTLAQAQNIPIAQTPYDLTVACVTTADLCLTSGDATATAVLHNTAGAGAPGTRTTTIPPPAAFVYNDAVMIVSEGLKCLDRDLTLRTCNGSASQLWPVRATGEIRSIIDNRCLVDSGGLAFTSNNCTSRSRRWDHLAVANNARALRNQETGRCLAAIAGASVEGGRVNTRNCLYTLDERWTFFEPYQGGGGAGAVPAAPLALILLLPLVMRRQRREAP